MKNWFLTRRPWAAFWIGLLASPLYSLLYLNRGQMALVFLAIQLPVAILGISFFQFELSGLDYWSTLIATVLFFQFLGAIFCFVIAKWVTPPLLRGYSRWWVLLMIWAFTNASMDAFRNFVYEPFTSPGESMSPTINQGDHFWVDRNAYWFDTPQYGDIVVFWVDEDIQYVKRVVGLPGDTIQFIDSLVVRNGVTLPQAEDGETIIARHKSGPEVVTQYFETNVDGLRYHVLNTDKTGQLDNTPVFVVPPFHYFVVGDNRDNSVDSRVVGEELGRKVGFVPESAFSGRAVIKYYDGTTCKFVWRSLVPERIQ